MSKHAKDARRQWSGAYNFLTTRQMISMRVSIPVAVMVSADALAHRKWKLDMECWLDKIVKNDGRVDSQMSRSTDAEVFTVYGEKPYVEAMVRCIEGFVSDVLQADAKDCGFTLAIEVGTAVTNKMGRPDAVA